MSVQIMRDPHPVVTASMWSSDGRDLQSSASANEIRDAYSADHAYFGTWEIDERARTVTHHIRGSMRAVEVGADYVRPYDSLASTLSFGPRSVRPAAKSRPG